MAFFIFARKICVALRKPGISRTFVYATYLFGFFFFFFFKRTVLCCVSKRENEHKRSRGTETRHRVSLNFLLLYRVARGKHSQLCHEPLYYNCERVRVLCACTPCIYTPDNRRPVEGNRTVRIDKEEKKITLRLYLQRWRKSTQIFAQLGIEYEGKAGFIKS